MSYHPCPYNYQKGDGGVVLANSKLKMVTGLLDYLHLSSPRSSSVISTQTTQQFLCHLAVGSVKRALIL